MAIAVIFNISNGQGSYMTYIISQTTATFIGFVLFLFVSRVATFGGTRQTQLQLLGISHHFFFFPNKAKILKNTEITEK